MEHFKLFGATAYVVLIGRVSFAKIEKYFRKETHAMKCFVDYLISVAKKFRFSYISFSFHSVRPKIGILRLMNWDFLFLNLPFRSFFEVALLR